MNMPESVMETYKVNCSDSSANLNKQVQDKTTNRTRLLRTLVLVFSFAASGMANNMVYSTLPDFRVRLDSSIEQISYAFSFGAVGTFASIPFSVLSDKFGQYSDAIIAVNLVIAAVVNTLRPFTRSLPVFTVCEFFDEVAWSTLNNVANSVMMAMWKDEGQSPMLAMHLGYPVGAAVGAQIASAFVSKSIPQAHANSLCYGNTTIVSHCNMTTEAISTNATIEGLKTIHMLNSSVNEGVFYVKTKSAIEIPFIIAGVYMIALVFVLMLLQICGLKFVSQQAVKKPSKWSDIFAVSKWSNNDRAFGIKIFLFFMFFQISFKGGDRGISQYLTTYAVDSNLGFSEAEAARMNSIAVLTDALSTLFCALVASRFLSVKSMLLIEVNGLMISSIGALVFGTRSKIALYIFACMYQAFKGPTWAISYAWVDHYIILLSTILASVRLTRNGVDILMIRLQGYLYGNVSIDSIFYTTIGYTGVMCLLVYVIYYVTYKRPYRYFNKDISHDKPNEVHPDTALKLV